MRPCSVIQWMRTLCFTHNMLMFPCTYISCAEPSLTPLLCRKRGDKKTEKEKEREREWKSPTKKSIQFNWMTGNDDFDCTWTAAAAGLRRWKITWKIDCGKGKVRSYVTFIYMMYDASSHACLYIYIYSSTCSTCVWHWHSIRTAAESILGSSHGKHETNEGKW